MAQWGRQSSQAVLPVAAFRGGPSAALYPSSPRQFFLNGGCADEKLLARAVGERYPFPAVRTRTNAAIGAVPQIPIEQRERDWR